MATIFNPSQDNDEDKKLAAQAPGVIHAQSGASGLMPNTPQGKPTSSGRFTNLQKFVKANQPGSGQGLSGQISKKVESQARDVQQGVQGAQEQFQQRVQQSLQPVQSAQQLSEQIKTDASKLTDEQMQQALGVRDYKYTGPQGLSNIEQTQSQAQQIQQIGQNLGSESGRFQTLRNLFAKPTYSTGQQRLDQLLLQTAPGQQQVLSQIRKTAGQVGSELSKAQQTAQQQALGAQQAGLQASEGLKTAVGEAATTGEAALEEQRQRAMTEYQNMYDKYMTELARGGLSQDTMQDLQLGEMDLYNIDPTQFFNPKYTKDAAKDFTVEQVATAEDYARMNALAKLAGREDLRFSDPTKREQFITEDKFGFDVAGLRQAVQGAKQNYEGLYNQGETTEDQGLRDMLNARGVSVGGNTSVKNSSVAPEFLQETIARGEWLDGKVASGFKINDLSDNDKRLYNSYQTYKQGLALKNQAQQTYTPQRRLVGDSTPLPASDKVAPNIGVRS